MTDIVGIVVVDTTFCGDYAGSVWGADGICNTTALTCNDYVAQHPGAFRNAYELGIPHNPNVFLIDRLLGIGA